MKKNTNKKIASTVKKFVVEASIEAKNLEKKSKKAIKDVEKKWESTKPERVKISNKAKKAVKDTVQIKDAIVKGFKQGIKEVKKTSKK